MRTHILIFDDDLEQMTPFKAFLEQKGFQVEITADAGILQRLSRERFHLILVDLMIHLQSPGPGQTLIQNVRYSGTNWMDTGAEFVKRLRAGEYAGASDGTPATVPVIVLSATAPTNGVSEANEVHEKPFDPNLLLQRIESLLWEHTP